MSRNNYRKIDVNFNGRKYQYEVCYKIIDKETRDSISYGRKIVFANDKQEALTKAKQKKKDAAKFSSDPIEAFQKGLVIWDVPKVIRTNKKYNG